jgi:WD40 repeat protein
MAVAVSADGTMILTGCLDNTARLWDAATGELRRELRHQVGVLNVAFSPDGRLALTGSMDGTAQLWEVASGRQVGPSLRHQGMVSGLAFSPDQQLVLTGSYDGTARLWDAGTGRPIGPPVQHPGKVTSVAFRPDGTAILSRSDDGTARLRTIARLSQDADHLSAWIETLTGLDMDDQGVTHVLDTDTWTERRGRLTPSVGPPRQGEVP